MRNTTLYVLFVVLAYATLAMNCYAFVMFYVAPCTIVCYMSRCYTIHTTLTCCCVMGAYDRCYRSYYTLYVMAHMSNVMLWCLTGVIYCSTSLYDVALLCFMLSVP